MNSAAPLGGRSPGEEVACSPQAGSPEGSSLGLWVWAGFLADRVAGQEGGWLTMGVSCSCRRGGRDPASGSSLGADKLNVEPGWLPHSFMPRFPPL